MAQPAYLFVLGHSLDLEKMAVYSAALPPIYEKYGGVYLGAGGPGRGVEQLEGAWFDHSLVLARFDSSEDVTKFWFSPEYEEAKKLRKDAGTFSVFVLPGNENESPSGEPAFLISIYRTVDVDAYAPLAEAEAEKFASRDVRYLARAAYDDTERLEGDLIDHDFTVAAFPTQASATAMWNDPDYQELRQNRSQIGAFNTFLVRGFRR